MQVARERRKKNEQREITLSKALNWALSICKPYVPVLLPIFKPLMRHVLSICKPVWAAVSSICKPTPAFPSRLSAPAKIPWALFSFFLGLTDSKSRIRVRRRRRWGPDPTPRRVCGGRTGLGRSSRFPAGFGCLLGRVKPSFACRSPTGSIRAPVCGVRAGARRKRAQTAAVHTWRAARHPFELALLHLYKTQRPTLRYALSMGERRARARFRIIEAQAKTVGI